MKSSHAKYSGWCHTILIAQEAPTKPPEQTKLQLLLFPILPFEYGSGLFTGMQSSLLGYALGSNFFPDPNVGLPSAISVRYYPSSAENHLLN